MVSYLFRDVATVFVLIVLARLTDSCSRSTRAVVSLTCPTNIHVTAERLSTEGLARWSRDSFRIDSTHPVRGLYQTYPDYGESAEISRYFPEGRHQVEYKAVDESGRFDQCTFDVNVHVTRCQQLYNPAFGVLNCDYGNVHGSTCTYRCLPGFLVEGEKSITCGSDGRWSHSIPICRIANCEEPGSPFWGSRYCSSAAHAFGTVCNFKCEPGYKVIGNATLICRLENNRVGWSSPIPTCRKIVPPKVEVCPSNMDITSDTLVTHVAKPTIIFRSITGLITPHICSHFGDAQGFNFTYGTHVVFCRGYDPDFGDLAVSICQFNIEIKPTPCMALPTPKMTDVMCSTADGPMRQYTKSCNVYCQEGFHFPRGVRGDTIRFYCDHTGIWKPTTRVPSCVVPSRPEEMKLPAEMFYSSTDCRNASQQEDVREHFQGAVQQTLRQESHCATAITDCIIDHVSVECRTGPVHRAKRMLLRDIKTVRFRHQPPRRRELPMRLHQGHDDSFQLVVQFEFGTQVAQTTGGWPDEYYKARDRLYRMYEFFEKKVQDGSFTISDRVTLLKVMEHTNSLTHDHAKAICGFGHRFNEKSHLCLPCGLGWYYSLKNDACYECPAGYYQDKQGQLQCIPCPLGTASLYPASQNKTECQEIDECTSNPCQNNGICRDRHLGYNCTCMPGYAGVNCEEKIYDCSIHSCQNGGSCKPQGEFNYTCVCRKGYLGQFCENQTVDGGWSEWTEWSACTKSCAGGKASRTRRCDSPVPANGGKPCKGPALHVKPCNQHECPVCKRLRRPYGGSISCREDGEHTLCYIKCPPGKGFSSPVLDQYVCGPNTSYIWPHESPDNPRCILPSCSKVKAANEASYQFKASFPIRCESNEQAEAFINQIDEMAHEYTKGISCISSGTCTLTKPDILGCPPIRKKRSTDHDHIEVKVAIIYRGNKAVAEVEEDIITYGDEPMPDMQKTTDELAALGEELLNKSVQGELYLMDGGHKVPVEQNSTVADQELMCARGLVPSFDRRYCVECRPGTFFSTNKDCTLCAVGFYQPLSAQLKCNACPSGYTTYGRGALLKVECYQNGTKPPSLPEEFPTYEEVDEPEPDSSHAIIPAVLVPLIIIIIIVLIVVILFRKKFRAKYNVVKKQRESMAVDEENEKAVELL